MTDRIRRFKEYAASKKVPRLIATPFYLRILWALGVDAKPGILSKNLLAPAFELSVVVSTIVMPLSMLAIWPTSRDFFTDAVWFLGTIGVSVICFLPGCYLAVKGHQKQLDTYCWEDL